MAAKDGPAPDHLNYLDRAKTNLGRFGFFALVRAAEALAKGRPRVGRSKTPDQNVADMAHAPTLQFPSTTLADIETTSTGRRRIRGYFLGLTGPMGPLPLHLTEFASFERRYSRKQPFGRFLDLISDRMLQFFYRAWAESQPVTHLDRPDDDRFSAQLAQLSGAWDGVDIGEQASLPNLARLFLAGQFASRRSPASIADALQLLLGAPVMVQEFVGRWRAIEADDRTRIGALGSFNQLGRDAVLGSRVRAVDDSCRVKIDAADMERLHRLIPSGDRFGTVKELLDSLIPPHIDWEVQLSIPQAAVTGVRLGGRERLGWSSWLGDGSRAEGSETIRSDPRMRGHAKTGRMQTGVKHG